MTKNKTGLWNYLISDPPPAAIAEEAEERIAIIMAEGADEQEAKRRAWERMVYRYGKKKANEAKRL